ncbi:MAG: TonB-dependent receptor [Bacteroidetes bacterium]|nr:TonB-dependent receptor [Bacteroidota bacterium]
MYKTAAIILSVLTCNTVLAQKDTLFNKTLEEVVITATRTERKLGNVAVPVSIINQKTIQQAGSQRLRDILQEQPGLFITNGFGAGVQLQGLNPDYTLLLLDGEPLIGRTAGVLDLNRLTVGNIKKIEIVKGPSSSLYGSEAMAGVINIITDHTYKKKLNAGIRYGFGNPDQGWSLPVGNNAFKNTDINIHGSTTINKLGLQYAGNAFYLDGISFRPFSKDRMPQPIWRITNQIQANYPFSGKTNLNVSVRYAYDHIKQEFAVSNNGSVTNSYGRETNQDINISPVLTHQFSRKVKSTLRIYGSLYNGSQILHFKEKPDSVYQDEFKQRFYRAENQTDISWDKMTLTLGAGYTIDEARSTRYSSLSSNKQNQIVYGYAQYEWKPSDRFVAIAGVRYDDNKLFAAAFSPKLAIRYKAGKKLLLNASVGRGFKAPDFRQLYLNFTNTAAGGYSVYGAIDAVTIINEQQRLGQIAEIKEDFYRLKELKPEFSTGINAGATYNYSDKLSFTLNLFRNDIEELIDVRQVATRINGSQIFSYINVKNAYTQGGEIATDFQLLKSFRISAGYQLLFTADKEELKSVKAGEQFTRDANGYSRILTRSEYTGLPNRSRHMANLKLNYENASRFFATARFLYRSQWAVANSDGNTVYNSNDEFAKGYVQVNISAGKELKNGLRLNAGVDNLLNYQDANYLPNMQGRMIYIGVQADLLKRKQN